MAWDQLLQEARADLSILKKNQETIYNKLKQLEEQEKQIIMILAENLKQEGITQAKTDEIIRLIKEVKT